MANHVHPEHAAIQAFAALSDNDPVVMLNMLRFRAQAVYPDGSGHTPCSGREAYGRYGAVAIEHVRAVGGNTIWIGQVQTVLIGPNDEVWDQVLLVQYPSRKAFMSMASNPEYLDCTVHRTAALADSRLIAMLATQPRM